MTIQPLQHKTGFWIKASDGTIRLTASYLKGISEETLLGSPIRAFLSESGVYDVSVGEDADDQDGDNDNDLDDLALAELTKYVDGVSESVPKGAPSSDFADPPSGLYVGDAKHAALAVQAVTSGFRGNKAKARGNPGVKSRIASAVRKFYSGAMQKYYLTWLNTGKKPGQRPTSESSVLHEMYIAAPGYSVEV